jgi:hypothetical protein
VCFLDAGWAGALTAATFKQTWLEHCHLTCQHLTHLSLPGTQGYSGDNGKATNATLSTPKGVAVDSNTGNIFIADSDNNVIRRVNPVSWDAKGHANYSQSGIITTFVGGSATAIQLNKPAGVFIDHLTSQVINDTTSARTDYLSLVTP